MYSLTVETMASRSMKYISEDSFSLMMPVRNLIFDFSFLPALSSVRKQRKVRVSDFLKFSILKGMV